MTTVTDGFVMTGEGDLTKNLLCINQLHSSEEDFCNFVKPKLQKDSLIFPQWKERIGKQTLWVFVRAATMFSLLSSVGDFVGK